MQQEFKRLLTETRQSIYAVAPSTSAVEELQKVGFSDAKTIARLLADPHEQAQLRGQVLLIDEAGMVSSKDMDELLGLAKKNGARIVFQRRHPAIEKRFRGRRASRIGTGIEAAASFVAPSPTATQCRVQGSRGDSP